MKTGMGDDWEDGDYMRVAVYAKSIDGSFKFITFKGYTSRGSGKNEKQLCATRDKIVEKIKEGTGLESVAVNQYSLEIKNAEDSKSVSIDFWVKA